MLQLAHTKKQGAEWLRRLILHDLKYERTASRSVPSRAKRVMLGMASAVHAQVQAWPLHGWLRQPPRR